MLRNSTTQRDVTARDYGSDDQAVNLDQQDRVRIATNQVADNFYRVLRAGVVLAS